jgi:hypothetical protein
MTVMNMCGAEETLYAEETHAAGASQPGEPQPQKTIEASDTSFGPGVVKIFDNCRMIVFAPSDKSKPTDKWTVITKGANDDFFIRNGDEGNLYPPFQVEDYFHLYLLGEKCGQPKEPESKPISVEDVLPSQQ